MSYPTNIYPAEDLPISTPAATDSMIGVDEANQVLRRFPLTAIPITDAQQAALDSIKSEVDVIQSGQTTNQIAYSTWSELSAITGSTTGQMGQVIGDNGSHTDSVSGQSVTNNGQYRWTGSAWEWLRGDVLALKADITDLDDRAGKYLAVNGDPLEAIRDPNNKVSEQLLPDGTRDFIKIKIGGVTIKRNGESGAKLEGRVSYGGVCDEFFGSPVDHDDWLEADVDSKFRVGRIKYKDGREVFPGQSSIGEATLLEMISLPDGAQGQNASGGFTITGIDKITTGKYNRCWVVGNDGRASESISTNLCSIVILSPDMRRIVKEFPMNTVLPVAGSIQGVAWDTSDNTIWFADQGSNVIQHIDLDGNILSDVITPGYIPNGLAYIAATDALVAPSYTTTTVNVLSCADGSVLSTVTGISASHDHLYYDAAKDYLWYTVGDNGSDGYARVMNLSTGAAVANYPMPGSQSIEGIHVDGDYVFIANDGGYHVAASPPLSVICKYKLETL